MARRIRDYVITALIALIVIVAALNLPARYFDVRSFFPSFGTALTDVQGSDNLSSFPTLYNANLDLTPNLTEANVFSALNQFTNASTSLLTVGNIIATTTATSTFTGGISALRYYATATSTFTNGLEITGGCFRFNNVCLGATTVTSVSNSDSTLTISPTTGDVVASLNLAKANVWTASTTFTGGLNSIYATTTAQLAITNGRFHANGVYYTFPSADGASSTVQATNGSGALTFNTISNLGAGHLLHGTSTNSVITDNSTETTVVSGATLRGGILGSNGGFITRVFVSDYSDAGSNSGGTIRLKLGGTTVCQISLGNANSATSKGFIEFVVYNTATNAQTCYSSSQLLRAGGNIVANAEDTSAVDTTTNLAITVTATMSNDTDAETITFENATTVIFGKP